MGVPVTRTRLSHALTLRVGGVVIGAIKTWSPTQARTVDTEFDVNLDAHGLPADLVPQTLERREMRVSRYDLYIALMEEVFGGPEIITLTDQANPFVVRERWVGPGVNLLGAAATAFSAVPGAVSGLPSSLGVAGSTSLAGALAPAQDAVTSALTSGVGGAVASVLGVVSSDIRVYEYSGCYFTDLGRNIDSTGDRVVSVEATVSWLSRRRLQ